MGKKHHYRDISKAKYLHSQDLGQEEWVLTIKEAKREPLEVPGRDEAKESNVLYWVEDEKPMVANAFENCGDVLAKLSGSTYVEDWAGLTIRIYRDPTVKGRSGDVVGALRVRDEKLKPKDKITKKHKDWEVVQKAVQSGKVGMRRLQNKYFMTPALYAELEKMLPQ